MEKFNIFIFDDEPAELKRYKEMCKQLPHVEAFGASEPDVAMALIRENFFQLALVDLAYHDEPKGNTLLAYLLDHRPTCERILLTRRPEQFQNEILKLLNPSRILANGVVDKRIWDETLPEFVSNRVKRWMGSPVQIDALGSRLAKLPVATPEPKVSPTIDEADYLLSSLHGQGKFDEQTDFEVAGVSAEIMTGGRSNSLVFKCQTRTAHHRDGIMTVVKLSPKEDAAEEYLRYSRYVRFLVSLDARVELLGYASGDTLGAICYSFAGKSPTDVCGLNELFDQQDARAEIVLNKLFAPQAQCWYAVTGKEIALTRFLEHAYKLDTRAAIKIISETMQNTQRFGVEVRQDGMVWKGVKIPNPVHTFGNAHMAGRFKSCIVHGDMNAGNIITAEDARVIMIDYRHTTVGPRALDFAALEAAIRLSSIQDQSPEQILGTYHFEKNSWKSNWSSPVRYPQSNKGASSYWQKTSNHLTSLARMNFQDIDAIEYACACFGWIARIIRVNLTFEQRLRLICWMGHLSSVIEQHLDQPE